MKIKPLKFQTSNYNKIQKIALKYKIDNISLDFLRLSYSIIIYCLVNVCELEKLKNVFDYLSNLYILIYFQYRIY